MTIDANVVKKVLEFLSDQDKRANSLGYNEVKPLLLKYNTPDLDDLPLLEYTQILNDLRPPRQRALTVQIEERRKEVRKLYIAGFSHEEIAGKLGFDKRTIIRDCNAQGLKKKPT